MQVFNGVLALLASLIAISSAWLLWTRAQRRLHYDMWRIPGPKPWPVIGNVGSIIGSSYVHKIFADWAAQYGPVYKWNLVGVDLLVVSDPQEIAKLTSREANIPKTAMMYKMMNNRPGFNNILSTSDHEEAKYYRRMTNPAFSPENIRKTLFCWLAQAFPSIYGAACKGAEVLHKMSLQGVVDVDHITQRVTAEVINITAFQEDLGSLNYSVQDDGAVQLAHQPFLEHLRVLQNLITSAFTNPLLMIFLTLCPWHPQARSNKAAVDFLQKRDDDTAAKIVAKGPQPETDTSLWACFSRFVDHRTGGPVHPTTIAVNAGIFFAAGYETTAHAIAWALFELAANPKIQDRVRKELDEAGLMAAPGQHSPRPLEFQDLTRLKELDAVVRETLRLHPTAPVGTARQLDTDMVIMGYRVPKGTPLLLSPYPLQVSPRNFVQPHRFWPERWTTDDSLQTPTKSTEFKDATPKGNVHNMSGSWNPFSSGPRNCIGQSLALAELRTVLAVFLGRFSFELPDGVQREKFIQEEQVWWVTLQGKNGVPLKVKPL